MNTYIINQSDKIPEVLLYGYIGNYQQNNSKNFVSDFKKLEATSKTINVRINSGGGDVFEGITIFNCLKNSTSVIHVFIDGLCASIASIIAMSGKRINMSKHSHFMAHRITGNVNGDAHQIAETANLMLELENSLVEIYSSRTGISKEEIQNTWMQTGKEKWLNAGEALALKLIDGIYDSEPVSEKNLTIYNKKMQMENINEILSFLNLREDTNTASVIAHLQDQKNEMENLKSEIEILQEEKVKFQNLIEQENKNKIQNLIDIAIREKRINEAQRNVYVTLAEANFEACKIAIQSIQPYKSITSQLQPEFKNEDELKTFEDYRKKNPQALKIMKENNPEKFSELYQAQYGSKPKLN
ncbi:MAG: head maturation protease, ClpP-related [Bacteroidota bacterium]